MREHDTVAGTYYRLGRNLVGDAHARSDVLIKVVDRRAAIAGVGSGACIFQGPVPPGYRVRQVRIEVAHVVVHLAKRREKVVAETQIKSKARGEFPVVLNIGRDGAKTSAVLGNQVLRKASFVDLAD